jgi:hypothetical protein
VASTPPSAAADNAFGTTSVPFSYNVLDNDTVGDPPATVITHTFNAATQGCGGLGFDPASGIVSGAPTDTPACTFTYTLSNVAGDSTGAVSILISI